MSDQVKESAVFEITDYTTASNWERFIALIEEVLTQWRINRKEEELPQKDLLKGDICGGLWHEKREILRYGNSAYDIKFLYLQIDDRGGCSQEETQGVPQTDKLIKSSNVAQDDECIQAEDVAKLSTDTLPECLKDMMSCENDFASKAHCLVRWYGLRHLIILSPRGDTIISENRVKLVLSSASIAMSNMNCFVPFFVQIHNPKSNFYQGISEHTNVRTMYEMVLQKKNIKQYSCLSELISLFRDKISLSVSDPISVTIRLNYCIDNFRSFQLPVNEHYANYQKIITDLMPPAKKPEHTTQVFYGPNATFDEVVQAMKTCEPLNRQILHSLQLGVIWLPRSDKVIIDNQVHSDLDPAEAPIWTLRCVAKHSGPMSIVHQTLTLSKLFNDAIEYSYSTLDGKAQFKDETPDSLRSYCLELSYKLAREPEIVLSESPADKIRKLVALIFHLAQINNEVDDDVTENNDGIKSVIKSLRHLSKTNLNEVYRNFNASHKVWIKEYILRAEASRPYIKAISSPLPQRMFCTINNEEFRLCGAFSESCN